MRWRCCCCSVSESCPTVRPHARCLCPLLSPGFVQIHVHWISDTIQHLISTPFFFCLQSFPASGSFPVSQFFTLGGQNIGASASASVLLREIQGWFILGLVCSPCSPRDSQQSSPALQFESISSSVLSLLYGPSLTSMHDYWKNYNFDYMDFCPQTDVSVFNMLSLS